MPQPHDRPGDYLLKNLSYALSMLVLFVGCEGEPAPASDACVGSCTSEVDGGRANEAGTSDDAGRREDAGSTADSGPRDDGGIDAGDAGSGSQGCGVVHTVEGSEAVLGSDSSVAVAADGTVWVSYLDGTDFDLKVAHLPVGGSWSTDTVDSVGRVGYYSSIAIDASGAPWVSYFDDTRRDPKVAHKPNGGVWTTTLLQPRGFAGWHTSLAIDGDGTVWVSWSDYSKSDQALKDIEVASLPSGGTWTVVDLDRSLPARQADFTDLAIDASGTVRVGYFASPMAGTVKFGTRTSGGSWSKTALTKPEDDIRTPAFTVAPDGTAWLAYTKAGDLKVANKPSGGTWSITRLGDAPALAGEISVAASADGSVWVSYGDDAHALKVAQRSSGGVWSTVTIDQDETVGADNALTVDGDGVAWVSYAATNDVNGTADVKVAKVVCP